MHRLFSLFLAMLLSLCVNAQEDIKVKTFKELSADLSARTNRRYDLNDEPCALIKVLYPKPGVMFEGAVIGDPEYRQSEYWVYVSKGTKRLRIMLPQVPTIVLEFSDFGVARVEGNTTYSVEFKYPSRFDASVYGELGAVVASPMALDLSLGTYLSNFNIEAGFSIPFGGSATVYWNHPSSPSIRGIYKPSYLVGGRIGYGIKLETSLRVTPQVGVRFLKTAETLESSTVTARASGSYSCSLMFALKAQFFLSKHLTVGLTPEYGMNIVASDGFKALSDISSDIKKWNNGFGIKLSIGYEF